MNDAATSMARLTRQAIRDFGSLVSRADDDLASPALVLSRLDSRKVDVAFALSRLDAMALEVGDRLAAMPGAERAPATGITTLNRYLFEELGFHGNLEHYDDPRNSFLDQVLERRTGIPISLAVVYLEVARRVGLEAFGVSFPGHFLLRFPYGATGLRRPFDDDLIIDPFHRGAFLSENDCRRLLEQHVEDDVAFDLEMLAPATKAQILTRMLVNLKHVYVKMRSFPQARDVTELLLVIDPSALTELRDRGLLSYNLNDFPAALRDLQEYLELSSKGPWAEESQSDRQQLWEHVKTLRRRVADLN